MKQSIAFHSYKGGTGKTTIAANLAAMLAARGHNVCLVDLDVYAPSLHTYFDYNPEKWINDLLSDNAKLADVMVDVTSTIGKIAVNSEKKIGKLWIGFSNPEKEEIYKLEGIVGKDSSSKRELLRRFIRLPDDLVSEYDSDYVIIDTSPGIRFWSINSLAVADKLLLTLKFGDLDIEGTKKMAKDIYGPITEIGAKSYVLLNRVAGYCVPHTSAPDSHKLELVSGPKWEQSDFTSTISSEVGISMISAIPCYCDIQFKRKEFLTAIQYPDHPFAKQLTRLADSDEFKT